MQDEDFRWFLANYNELYKKHGYSFLVIKNKMVLGVYKSFKEAVESTSPTEELGSFIVQECNGDDSAYTVQIASMAFPMCEAV